MPYSTDEAYLLVSLYSFFCTETVHVRTCPSVVVAVTFAAPAFLAVTFPAEFTVATLLSLLAHVTSPVAPETESFSVKPFVRVIEFWLSIAEAFSCDTEKI